MSIEELMKKRKELKLSVKMMSRLTGYSAVWLYQIERGERRISKKLIETYQEAINNFEKMKKK